MKNNKRKILEKINLGKKKIKNERKIKQIKPQSNRREKTDALERDLNIESFMNDVLNQIIPENKIK